MIQRVLVMTVLLTVAAFLEVGGDALVRVGLGHAGAQRIWYFAFGAVVLFAYGVFVNTAPADFGRLLGIYVVLFFIVAQVVNFVAFRVAPSPSILVGGVFIIIGGAVMTAWT